MGTLLILLYRIKLKQVHLCLQQLQQKRRFTFLKNCITKHLESITAKIIEVGGNVEDHGDSIRVWCNKRPNKANIKNFTLSRISY